MRKKYFVIGTPLCLFVVLLLYALLVEPYRLRVSHETIKDGKLGKMATGMVAVLFSDVHLDCRRRIEQLVFKELEAIKPDIIFAAGDFVKWGRGYESALEFLSKLKARNGAWAVMGDYDYSQSRQSCLFCHESGSAQSTTRHSVKFLRNSADRISTPGGWVWIAGIDAEAEGASLSKESLLFLKGKEPAIILSHSPLVFDLIDDDQDVLMLAGDTHGGQIPLPSWAWRLLGYEKNAKYEQGWFVKGKKRMYVSRGFGTSHLPVRFLRPPEITVFHFEAPGNN